eukprot:9243531-Pyramimonas_sp.AAC.2
MAWAVLGSVGVGCSGFRVCRMSWVPGARGRGLFWVPLAWARPNRQHNAKRNNNTLQRKFSRHANRWAPRLNDGGFKQATTLNG